MSRYKTHPMYILSIERENNFCDILIEQAEDIILHVASKQTYPWEIPIIQSKSNFHQQL